MRILLGLLVAAIAAAPCAVAQSPEDVNVALSRWGSRATASSRFSPAHGPEKAIDGKWAALDADKWCSAPGESPSWLVIDFGAARTIHRIVVKHEGVHAEGETYNTSDFQLQSAAAASGPWIDIVPPIVGNRQDQTTHDFAPVTTRYIRLLVTKGTPGTDEYSRIYEVESYSRLADLSASLVALTFPIPGILRGEPGKEERLATAWACLPPAEHGPKLSLEVGDRIKIIAETITLINGRDIWIPAPERPTEASLRLVAVDGEKRTTLAEHPITLPGLSVFRNGTYYIIPSSHNDIAWLDTPQRTFDHRDTKVIGPALDVLAKNPEYCFSMECGLYLKDYLERHPDRKDEIARLIKTGRFEWGGTFNQAYESMWGGESLVHQVLHGRKWLRRTLPGCDTHIAYNVDVPARALQAAQVFKKAGINYLFISRQREGLFRWRSPDGSEVLTYSPGIYWDPVDTSEFRDAAPAILQRVETRIPTLAGRGVASNYPYFSSRDYNSPDNFDSLFAGWRDAVAAAHDRYKGRLEFPKLRYATASQFMQAAAASSPNLPVIQGERPNLWLYASPSHREAVAAGREAENLLVQAETFASIRCWLEGNYNSYPSKDLYDAWECQIYTDHGWGGNNGDVTDQVFLDKLNNAKHDGHRLLTDALTAIASHIPRRKGDAIPIVVFNPLPWAHTGPVSCTIDAGSWNGEYTLVDASDAERPFQVTATTGDTTTILFTATAPPLGYTTYCIVGAKASPAPQPGVGQPTQLLENSHYRIELDAGGITSIRQKSSLRELLDTSKYRGGEMLYLQSVGNCAGEFREVQPTSMEGFDRLANHPGDWTLEESGPIRQVARIDQPFAHCTVRRRLILYNDLDRIDMDVSILGWDGTQYREFRLAFPTTTAGSQVSYAVPFGSVRVGKDELPEPAGGMYPQPCKDVRPREVQQWIDAGGITICSDVNVWDFLDPTPDPLAAPMLQPVLLSSRRSCHGNGNWYLQKGDHEFHFSIYAHAGDSIDRRKAEQFAKPLIAIPLTSPTAVPPLLPAEFSFASLASPNVMLSTIRKCDDENAFALRFYDISGKDGEILMRLCTPIRSAQHTNIIEEEGVHIPSQGYDFRQAIGHHAIETYTVQLNTAAKLESADPRNSR